MIYVGIDVASQKHDVCITSNEGEVFENKFQIKNTNKSYLDLISKIEKAKKEFKDEKVTIGLESTGVYSSTLVNFFSTKKEYNVIYINPLLTNMFQLSESIHYTKTDAIDSEGICSFLMEKKNKIKTFVPTSKEILEIKTLYRELIKLNKQITQSKNRLTGLIHMVFPEFLSIFPKIKGNLVLSLLNKYPTPNMYKNKKSKNLLEFAKEKSKGHIEEDKILKLIELSKNSVGAYSISDKILIMQLSELIIMLENHKKVLIEELNILVKRNAPNLLTIPGVGANTAAGIIGEIGDINNFSSPSELTAFSGLNPLVYQSGNFEAKHTRISKRGSRYLRNALIMSARVIIKKDKIFKEYYDKKRKEGKSFDCAIGSVSRKLIRIIYSLLRNNNNFVYS